MRVISKFSQKSEVCLPVFETSLNLEMVRNKNEEQDSLVS